MRRGRRGGGVIAGMSSCRRRCRRRRREILSRNTKTMWTSGQMPVTRLTANNDRGSHGFRRVLAPLFLSGGVERLTTTGYAGYLHHLGEI